LQPEPPHDWTRRRFLQALALASLGGTVSIPPASPVTAPLERRGARAFESHPGLETVPGVLTARDGTRLRTFVTRPAGTRGPRPAVLFVPWLSCDTIELHETSDDGWSRMLKRILRESGCVVMRTEKRGVGDSEGGPCAQLDYLTELSDHRDALAQLRASAWVDPERIVVFGASMGANYAPLVAAETNVAGVLTWGGGARPWFERMITFERNRREQAGMPGAQADAEMKQIAAFLHHYLVEAKAPVAIAREQPRLAAAWSLMLGTEDDRHYGRPLAFHQQAQQQDWAGAWSRIEAPTLAMFGGYDWYEDSGGARWIADLVNATRPGHGRFTLVPHTDHHFVRYPDAASAVRGHGGVVDADPATDTMLAWLHDVVPARPGAGG
jgi:pimeloyl-ACP methyl ester carboxylesterase